MTYRKLNLKNTAPIAPNCSHRLGAHILVLSINQDKLAQNINFFK